MQMSVHSTLGSYVQRLIWLLTGNFGRKGTNYAPLSFVSLTGASKAERTGTADERPKVSPVVGAKIITGLIPCNVMAEEILTDHPNRYRAMLIESGNPLHSVADSQQMREAMRALELLVVIDVALSESAREAHYVLPASSQFEKVRGDVLQPRVPAQRVPPAPSRDRAAARHARRAGDPRAPGRSDGRADRRRLRAAARGAAEGRAAFAERVPRRPWRANPRVAKYAPIVLYRTLGQTLPEGMAAAAIYWAFAHQFVQKNPDAAARAGFDGDPFTAGEKLFDAILTSKHRRRLLRRGLRRELVAHPHARAARSTSRSPSSIGELEKLAAGPRPRDRDVPVHPLGRRAPLRHHQHDHPQPGVAGEGARRHAAHERRRRAAARLRRRRPRAPEHAPRQRRGARRGHRHDAARPHLAAERRRHGLQAARRRRAPRRRARRTSSPAPPSATSSPARRGTSTCRRGWRESDSATDVARRTSGLAAAIRAVCRRWACLRRRPAGLS